MDEFKNLLEIAGNYNINLAVIIILCLSGVMIFRLSSTFNKPEAKHEVRLTAQAADDLLSRLHVLEQESRELHAEIKSIRGILIGNGFTLDH